jgi:uncharacterized membrane protein
MNESQDPILDLDKRLNELIRNELQLRQQIDGLKHEIYQIKLKGVPSKATEDPEKVSSVTILPQNTPPLPKVEQPGQESDKPLHIDLSGMFNPDDVVYETQAKVKKQPGFDVKQDLEKFIGENLINKIGILILVLGVGIGTRYAIEHDMISPLARILLGYLLGIGLLGTAFRLKAKFENFSAVLLSGAMAILYLLTFAAYDLYQLIPQLVAFGIMVFFTGFTVFAAIQYNQPIIAHLGLVGAYAVPFLLSSGSGQVGILFSYMALLNGGILVVAFQRYWQSLHFTSFGFTWLIFISWMFTKFNIEEHLVLGLGFSSLFLMIFYISFLSYKLIRNEVFESVNLLLILINATVYFMTGMFILEQQKETASFEGLFTFINAVLHFGVALLLKSRKPENKQLLVMLGGLVIVFITIAIPVQLDGNFVTVLWIAFAAFMFFLSSKYSEPMFERISVGLIALAFFSLLQDWDKGYHHFTLDTPEKWLTPIFNGQFLSSVLFLGCLGFIWKLLSNQPPDEKSKLNPLLFQKAIPGLFICLLFGAFCMEISNFWHQLSENSRYVNTSDISDYDHFGFDPAYNLQ